MMAQIVQTKFGTCWLRVRFFHNKWKIRYIKV